MIRKENLSDIQVNSAEIESFSTDSHIYDARSYARSKAGSW